MAELWKEAMLDSYRGFMGKVAKFLPNLMAMMSLLLLGLIIGWAVKAVINRVLKVVNFNNLCDRWGLSQVLTRGGIGRPPSQVLSLIFFWAIFLAFALMGIGALELPATYDFISLFFRYLPNILAAILILLVGWLLAHFIAQGVLIAAVNAHIRAARLLSQSARWVVLVFTVAMALTQLGIAKELVVAAFSIAFGGLILTLAIAFGLGGRDLARDLLERRFKKGEEERKDEISHL